MKRVRGGDPGNSVFTRSPLAIALLEILAPQGFASWGVGSLPAWGACSACVVISSARARSWTTGLSFIYLGWYFTQEKAPQYLLS